MQCRASPTIILVCKSAFFQHTPAPPLPVHTAEEAGGACRAGQARPARRTRRSRCAARCRPAWSCRPAAQTPAPHAHASQTPSPCLRARTASRDKPLGQACKANSYRRLRTLQRGEAAGQGGWFGRCLEFWKGRVQNPCTVQAGPSLGRAHQRGLAAADAADDADELAGRDAHVHAVQRKHAAVLGTFPILRAAGAVCRPVHACTQSGP